MGASASDSQSPRRSVQTWPVVPAGMCTPSSEIARQVRAPGTTGPSRTATVPLRSPLPARGVACKTRVLTRFAEARGASHRRRARSGAPSPRTARRSRPGSRRRGRCACAASSAARAQPPTRRQLRHAPPLRAEGVLGHDDREDEPVEPERAGRRGARCRVEHRAGRRGPGAKRGQAVEPPVGQPEQRGRGPDGERRHPPMMPVPCLYPPFTETALPPAGKETTAGHSCGDSRGSAAGGAARWMTPNRPRPRRAAVEGAARASLGEPPHRPPFEGSVF